MRIIQLKSTRLNADHVREYGPETSDMGERPTIDFHTGNVILELQFNSVEARNKALKGLDAFLEKRDPYPCIFSVGAEADREQRISMRQS